MALLWVQAMAWHDGSGLKHDEAQPVSVRHVGFKGYVGAGDEWQYGHEPDHEKPDHFHEDLYEDTTPEPTEAEQAHYDKHGEYPESHYERHDQAYARAVEKRQNENKADIEDGPLHGFISYHGGNNALWQTKGSLGKVDLRKGVYATQSHVSKRIMDEHEHDPAGGSWNSRWQRSKGREPYQGDDKYLGEDHPMFVTHEGRLHATEGHHRVAVALQRGDSHIVGWHYDADKHGLGQAPCTQCGYEGNDPLRKSQSECDNCGEPTGT